MRGVPKEPEEMVLYKGVVIKKKQRIKAEDFPSWLKALVDYCLSYDLATVVVVIDPEEKVRDVLKPVDIMVFIEKFIEALEKRTKLSYIAIDGSKAPPRPQGAWREFVPLLTFMRAALAVAVLYFKEPKPGWLAREGSIVVEIA